MRGKLILGLMAVLIAVVTGQVGSVSGSIAHRFESSGSALSKVPDAQRRATEKRNQVSGSYKRKGGKKVVMTGRLEFYEAAGTINGAEHGEAPFTRAVRVSSSRLVPMHVNSATEGDTSELVAGQQVEVSGIERADESVTATSIAPVADPPGGGSGGSGGSFTPQTGAQVRTVAVIRFHFQNYTYGEVSEADLREVIFDGAKSASEAIYESSYGDVSLAGDFFGSYSLPYAPDCSATNEGQWAQDAEAMATAQGANLDAYDHVAYVYPRTCAFPYGGFANVSGRYTWNAPENKADAYRVITHELGHNLGIMHANAVSCKANEMPRPLSNDCTHYEYNDSSDFMGAWATHNLSGYHRARLGYLPASNIQNGQISDGSEYTIKSIENRASAGTPQLLRIPRVGAPTSDPRNQYYFESRRSFGQIDDWVPGTPIVNGVSVRVAGDYNEPVHYNWTGPDIIYPNHAMSYGGVLAGVLADDQIGGNNTIPLGGSLYDPFADHSFTVTSFTEDSATIRVNSGAPPGASTSVAVDGTKIVANAGPNKLNNIIASLDAGWIYVADLQAAIVPGSDCEQVDPITVRCAAAGINSIEVNAGDGNDIIGNPSSIPMTVFGGDGVDSFDGGPAADTFDGGPGDDAFTGGGGSDTLSLESSTTPKTIVESSTATVYQYMAVVATSGGERDYAHNDVERFIGGSGNDTFEAHETQGSGLTFDGGPGDDTFSSGNRQDTMVGGPGSDSFNTEDIDGDTVSCGSEADSVIGDAGDIIGSDCENVTVAPRSVIRVVNGVATFESGPAVVDDIDIANVGGTLTVSSRNGDLIAAGPGCMGGGLYVACTGTPDSMQVNLNDGDDRVKVYNPSQSPAVFHGGDGNDTLEGGTVSDSFFGDDGIDIVSYSQRSAGVYLSIGSFQNGADGEGDFISTDVEALRGGYGGDSLNNYNADGEVNYFDGGPGDDYLGGGDGNDELYAGDGDDRLDGGAGDDVYYGDAGMDVAYYQTRYNPVTAVIGTNSGNGEAGESDSLGDQVESIEGGHGDDVLTGGWQLRGNGGNDVLSSASYLSGGPGDDVLSAIQVEDEYNWTYGSEMYGDDGDDTLNGGIGDDLLRGGLGADSMNGGVTGFDTVNYSSESPSSAVNITYDNAANDGRADEGDNIARTIDQLELTGHDDYVDASAHAGSNYITAFGGNDTLIGGNSMDVFAGDDGDDTMDGGRGGDVLWGDNGSDTILYSSRTAAITANLGVYSQTMGEAGERDYLAQFENAIGGAGNDTLGCRVDAACALTGGDGNDSITGNNMGDQLTGGDGNDTIAGGNEAPEEWLGDNIIGGDGADTLSGNDGDDTINGGADGDAMSGGSGVDTLADYDDRTTDTSLTFDWASNDGAPGEGDNVDTVEGVHFGSGNDTVDTGSTNSAMYLYMKGGNDTVATGNANDVIELGAGDDIVDAGRGSDFVWGEAGDDTVSYATRTNAVTAKIDASQNDGEANERDYINTDVENLIGGSGNDVLTGNQLANSLTGGAGDDTITGNAGVDSFNGNDGADIMKSRDGGSDAVNCGADIDSVTGDTIDSIYTDCETSTTLTTVITAGPSGPTNNSTAQFQFTSDEPTATFECSNVISGQPDAFAACASGITYDSLADGTYQFKVRAKDASNNLSQSMAASSYTVDTAAPAAPLITQPANDTITNNPQPTLAGDAEPGSTVKLYHGDDLFSTSTADGSGFWIHSWVTYLSGASHTFTATATDAAGNVSAVSAPRLIVIDQIAPETTIPSPATDDTIVRADTAAFTFATNESSTRIDCRINGGSWVTNCGTSYTTPVLANGQHTIEARAVDAAGNFDQTPASRRVWISIPVSQLIKIAPITQSTSVNLAASGATDFAHWGTSTASLTADRKSGVNLISDPVQIGGTLARVTTGVPSYSWTGGAPTASSSGTRTAINVGGAIGRGFQFTVPALHTQQRELKLYVGVTNTSGNLGLGINDGTASVTDTTVSQSSGTRNVVFTIRFRANSAGKNLTVTWTQNTSASSGRVSLQSARLLTNTDVAAPTTTISSGPANGATITTSTATFGFTSNESGSTFQCRVDSGTYATCTSPFTTPVLGVGSHTFDVRAIDSAGNVTGAPPRRTFTKQ